MTNSVPFRCEVKTYTYRDYKSFKVEAKNHEHVSEVDEDATNV